MTYSPTYTARAATAGELVKFRADGNASRIYTIFDIPVVVFAAQINQVFATHDMVAALTFDNVTVGAYTDCWYGMTVLISSALPATQANTVGITHVRVSATSPLKVGESSEIPYADNLYISVLDEFGIWQDHIRAQSDGTAFVRYDRAYADEHTNWDPTPIIGTDRAARLPAGGTVTLTFGEASYCIDGTAISSRVRQFPGASATTNLTSATSTATYNATGRYKYRYDVTAANGKSRRAWRDIYIYDDTHLVTIDPTIDGFTQDWDAGGSEFSMTVYQDATTAQIRDRTKVILVEEAIYGGVAGSIGPLAGSENIVGIGWLDDESVTLDWLKGTISLTAKTAHYWLNRENAFVLGYKDVAGTPAKWIEINSLTPDFAAWDAIAWRSTLMNCADVQFTGDTRIATELQAPQGSLWSQITAIMQETIFARPCCDNYGRVFIEIDTALVPIASRASYPVVMALTRDDYETADINRVTVTKTGRVDLSGVAVSGPTTGSALYSLADGHVFNHYGETVILDQLLLATQAQANQLAADYKAAQNKPITLDFSGLANNRLIGIAPHQFLSTAIATTDTLRGIAYSGNMIVRRIDWTHDALTGIVMSIGCDPETSGALSVNGDIPVVADDGTATDPWTPPILPPIPPIIVPPVIPPPPTSWMGNTIALLINGQGIWHTSVLVPGYWYCATSTFSAYDISTMKQFDLCRASLRAYIASDLLAWSTVLGTNAPAIIGSAPIFLNRGGDSYSILAIGADPWVDQVCGVVTYEAHVPSSSANKFGYLTDTTGVLVPTTVGASGLDGLNGGPVEANRILTRYLDKWYLYGFDVLGSCRFERYDNALASRENELVSGTFGGGVLWHSHATAADYTYLQRPGGGAAVVITADGTTQAGLPQNASATANTIDCDPTGRYVMQLSGALSITPKYSSDFGATWTDITSLPTQLIYYSRVCNMGDATHWVVQLNDTTAGSVLKVFYTDDAGVSWVNITGNLTTQIPDTSRSLMMRVA